MLSVSVVVKGCSVRLGRENVLRSVDLEVSAGEIVGLVGSNGSGKSTLLRVVAGLIRPDEGTVEVFGEPPTSVAASRRIGAAIDAPALYPWMSGAAALRTLQNLAGEPDAGRAVQALRTFGLAEARRKLIVRYSQGMKKRLALAGAQIRNPDLLLLDEPTNALDADGRDFVGAWIGAQKELGKAVLVATHRATEVALCDRVLRLEDGSLTAEASD